MEGRPSDKVRRIDLDLVGELAAWGIEAGPPRRLAAGYLGAAFGRGRVSFAGGGRHFSPRIIATGFRGGIRHKRRPRPLVEYHWALAGYLREPSGFRPDVPVCRRKEGGTTVRFVIWADRERTADLAVSHAVTCQLPVSGSL